jgi:hypothetical protein
VAQHNGKRQKDLVMVRLFGVAVKDSVIGRVLRESLYSDLAETLHVSAQELLIKFR